MHLTAEEQKWLETYRSALAERYPGMVRRLIVYGSKARGNDTPDSDLDILLIVKDEAGAVKRELRRMGHVLAAATPVAPSILAYAEAEWDRRRTSRSPFREAVEREGVPIL